MSFVPAMEALTCTDTGGASAAPIPSFSLFLATIFTSYVLIEICFFYYYHWHLLPRVNRIVKSTPPAPYRDCPHPSDRLHLLNRILDRLEKRVPKNTSGDDAKTLLIYNFIESWFLKSDEDAAFERFSERIDVVTLDAGLCPPLPPLMRLTSSLVEGLTAGLSRTWDMSLSQSSDGSLADDDSARSSFGGQECLRSNNNSKRTTSGEMLKKGNVDEFLAWAFFGVHHSTVKDSPIIQCELDRMHEVLHSRCGLSFELGFNPKFTPRCFTLEEVNAMYRPFLVYASVLIMGMTANCILWVLGFRSYTCRRGLRYWHRPASHPAASSIGKEQSQNKPPFLFFHGIAPGGHSVYLPFLLYGMLRKQSQLRDVFLFENKPISYALCLDAVSEEDTVDGVVEALERHLDPKQADHSRLTVCGHSFGTCVLTWLINSPRLRDRIGSMILLDPVSILLSEPDVMNNFLYSRSEDEENDLAFGSGWVSRVVRFVNESKIWLVASSEVFIEHYLRRDFAWYNSELWLSDIPRDVEVLVCLAECDEIVNASKVEKEVRQHNAHFSDAFPGKGSTGPTTCAVHIKLWEGVGHAHCVANPDRWKDVRDAMNQIGA